jgi:hypothetical protein
LINLNGRVRGGSNARFARNKRSKDYLAELSLRLAICRMAIDCLEKKLR